MFRMLRKLFGGGSAVTPEVGRRIVLLCQTQPALLEAFLEAGKSPTVASPEGIVHNPTRDELERAVKIVKLSQRADAAPDERSGIKLYEQVVQLNPYDAIAWMSIGCMYANWAGTSGDRNHAQKAVENVKKAHAIDPGNERIKQNMRAMGVD